MRVQPKRPSKSWRSMPIAIAASQALAGLSGEFPATPKFKVVEELPGTGSTDFWAISWVPATSEQGQLSKEAFERKLAILRACWKYFDRVVARVSPELKKGPRGGGRNRDQIIRHIFVNEQQWAKMFAVDVPDDAMLTAQGRAKYRNAYVRGLRAYNAAGKSAADLATPIPPSTHSLPRDGPRLGDGGQGSDQCGANRKPMTSRPI